MFHLIEHDPEPNPLVIPITRRPGLWRTSVSAAPATGPRRFSWRGVDTRARIAGNRPLSFTPTTWPAWRRPGTSWRQGHFGSGTPDNRDHFLQFIPPVSRLRGLRWSRGNAETVTQIRQLFQYDRTKDHSITTGYRKVIA